MTGQAQIVCVGKGKVACNVLKGSVLGAEFVIGISGVSGAGKTALSRRWSNPYELVRCREGQRTQKQRVHHAENSDIGADS